MTWEDWHSARQQLAEEFLGAPLREIVRREDEQVKATQAAIRQYAKPPQANTPAVIPPRPIADEILG